MINFILKISIKISFINRFMEKISNHYLLIKKIESEKAKMLLEKKAMNEIINIRKYEKYKDEKYKPRVVGVGRG